MASAFSIKSIIAKLAGTDSKVTDSTGMKSDKELPESLWPDRCALQGIHMAANLFNKPSDEVTYDEVMQANAHYLNYLASLRNT